MLHAEGFVLQALHWLSMVEPAVCTVALLTIIRSGQLRPYRYLAAMLSTRLISNLGMIVLMQQYRHLGLSDGSAYDLYFYGYWASYAIEALLGFGAILSIYKLAMAPLKGLQGLGMIMFRWAAGISVAIAITIGFGPHVTSDSFIVRAVSQLQQTQSVLTLCMLLFVCLAIHPMGLSFRSRIFGVSLGLGIVAAVDIVQAAWLSHVPQMNTIFSLVSSISICLTIAIWSVYFAFPEPKRRMIVLPTTSPFLRWNQISQVLNDEPGFVALGEVTMDMFAPAEIEVMRRASNKMNSAMNF